MKKDNFISLILGVFGGLLFALGMCMCLLPEWNAFTPGVVFIVIGLIALAALLALRIRKNGLPAIHISGHTLSAIALGVAGTLTFGGGMCLVLVWQLLIPGILVGLAGVALLLCLIPFCIGLK